MCFAFRWRVKRHSCRPTRVRPIHSVFAQWKCENKLEMCIWLWSYELWARTHCAGLWLLTPQNPYGLAMLAPLLTRFMPHHDPGRATCARAGGTRPDLIARSLSTYVCREELKEC